MKATQKILITLVIGAVLIVGFYMTTKLITDITGFSISGSEKDDRGDFGKCLKEQDVVLYVKSTKILKDIQLYDYLDYVEIVNCENKERACLDIGIDSFPSWVVNNNKISKDISLEELSMVSGCKL